MSAELRIEIDQGPWAGADYAQAYPVGGRVTGRLVLTVPERQRATNVRAELHWETSGRGSRNSKKVGEQVLLTGDLLPGPDRELPFELAVPDDGPITYHGHYININWKVVGRIDIKWAIDKTADAQLRVLPSYDQP